MSLKMEGALRVSPDVSVAGHVLSQIGWLPSQEEGPIWRRVDDLPDHRSHIPDDARRLEKVIHSLVFGELTKLRKPLSGGKVDIWELAMSALAIELYFS